MTAHKVTRASENWVANTPIREAVERAEREGLDKSMICRRLEWFDRDRPDTTRLDRRIGRRPETSRKKLTSTIRYDLAVQICRAIERAPVELDL